MLDLQQIYLPSKTILKKERFEHYILVTFTDLTQTIINL